MFAIDTNGQNATNGQDATSGRGAARGSAGPQPSGANQAFRPTALSSLLADPVGFGLGFVRRHLVAITLFGLLGLGLGIGLALLVPNRYSSTAQLLIDPRDLRVLQNEIAPQAVGSDVTTAYLESQARVIASDSIKRRVIDRLDLALDPDFGGRRAGLAERLGLSAGPSGPQRDPVLTALDVMDKQVQVRRGERTFVIDITAISSEGPKSARIANAMAEAYLDDQSIVRSESATRASASLTARLSELRERVRLAEDKVEKYRAANNLVGASGKLVTEEQLAVSNMQLTQARARLADAQAKFDQVRIVRPTSIEAGATPEALSSSSIAALRAQLGTALTREADALVLYGAQHPQLLSAQAQVRDSRRQIAEELARTVQAARAELDRARASEASLNAQVERLKRDTLTTGQAAVQLRELEREADANRQVYQAFLLRARETGEQSSVDSTNARIITSAVVPRDKLGPNRKLFAALGLVAGLALGVLFGLLRDLAPLRRHAAAVQGADLDGPEARKVAGSPAGMPRGLTPAAATSGSASAGAAAAPRGTGRWRGLAGAATVAAAPAAGGGPLVVSLPAVRALANWRKQPVPERSAFHGSGFGTDAWD
ncbi:MAG: GumC family protein, partial [Beijerinckiaceae bacterium]|nr:GumC family protein [Beijerinckiaceae bacterium]